MPRAVTKPERIWQARKQGHVTHPPLETLLLLVLFINNRKCPPFSFTYPFSFFIFIFICICIFIFFGQGIVWRPLLTWFFWCIGASEGHSVQPEVLPNAVLTMNTLVSSTFPLKWISIQQGTKTPRWIWFTWAPGFSVCHPRVWRSVMPSGLPWGQSCNRLLSRGVSLKACDGYLLIEGKTSWESRPCASPINMKISLARALRSLPKWPWLAQRWQSASLRGPDSIAITARLTNRSH